MIKSERDLQRSCPIVRVRKYFPDGGFIILQTARPACVIPTRDEEPPMSIEENDPSYRLSPEKDVFQDPPSIGKAVGRLVASTAELPSLKLPHPCEDAGNSPTLTASVKLRFQPASQGEPPPRLDSITMKLHSFTFFETLPYEIILRPVLPRGSCGTYSVHEYNSARKLHPKGRGMGETRTHSNRSKSRTAFELRSGCHIRISYTYKLQRRPTLILYNIP